MQKDLQGDLWLNPKKGLGWQNVCSASMCPLQLHHKALCKSARSSHTSGKAGAFPLAPVVIVGPTRTGMTCAGSEGG